MGRAGPSACPATPARADGVHGVGERQPRLDQRRDDDRARRQRRQRRRERAAARADDRDLVDDDRRQVQRGVAGERALEDQRAARAQRGERRLQAFAAAGAVDDDVGAPRRPADRPASRCRGRRGAPACAGAGRPPSGRSPVVASTCAITCPSLPSPNTTTRSRASIAHLRQDLERRGDRLGEHRDVVGHAVRHGVQVRDRQRQVVGERAVAVARCRGRCAARNGSIVRRGRSGRRRRSR